MGTGLGRSLVPSLEEGVVSLTPTLPLEITATARASIYRMLARGHPFLRSLLSHIIFTANQRAKYYYYHHSHFTDGKVKAKTYNRNLPKVTEPARKQSFLQTYTV